MKTDGQDSAAVVTYIAAFPPEVQARLEAIRELVRAAAPEAVEKMAYGIPTFTLGENLIHYAAFSRHIGLYPGPLAIAAFAGALSVYKHAKGSIQFPLDQPLPLDLIKQIVAFRVKDARARQSARR